MNPHDTSMYQSAKQLLQGSEGFQGMDKADNGATASARFGTTYGGFHSVLIKARGNCAATITVSRATGLGCVNAHSCWKNMWNITKIGPQSFIKKLLSKSSVPIK
ncbi:hypothetical protein TWF730_001590 [Orbilia blumenaviensis]|uniref:Uncharacterized protein n=1 Tax=Orbilia blumenaviensis TaxID=1796055 RepID=A0AAV9ULH7_9PEZI